MDTAKRSMKLLSIIIAVQVGWTLGQLQTQPEQIHLSYGGKFILFYTTI